MGISEQGGRRLAETANCILLLCGAVTTVDCFVKGRIGGVGCVGRIDGVGRIGSVGRVGCVGCLGCVGRAGRVGLDFGVRGSGRRRRVPP